ncbi:MAG: aromatic ring-hydroxylating dioxygenase subunit alpha [Gammaproteobacteria bacterium]|nr:MAG: aromatic ring-hydroxylating dioxygenase subunit alpha [Gammaproteobacteria bacterium]
MYINFWYPAAWSEQLGDRPRRVRMLGQDFVLFRDSDGRARCLADTCIHRGGSLAGGKLVGDCVQCPYHGWEFAGDGRCRRIPSLGPQAKIPRRARVDAYPVAERYGIVFAFLGDLPENERPPIMEIPEYGQPGWRVTRQERFAECDYRRQLENALDPAHNEFVHPTHGFSGERDDYRVPPLNIERSTWGSGFLTTYFAPPLKDERMKSASGRDENAVIEAGTHHFGPCALTTRIHPTPEVFIHQHVFKVPVSESEVRTFLVQTRNFLLEPEHDSRFLERNEIVAGQDAEVLADLHPFFTPETNAHEFLVPADQAVLAYREKLAEWQARGWRIDARALAARGRREAFAIPSPARREQPRGWVLDSVPLLPAATAAEQGAAAAG